MASENAKLIDFNGTNKEQETIDSISKDTQKILRDERNINITMAAAIPTIVYDFLYCASQFLEKNKSTDADTVINLMNLIEMGVTYRETEDGDKTGNFTPFIQPGTIMKTIIKSDEVTENED